MVTFVHFSSVPTGQVLASAIRVSRIISTLRAPVGHTPLPVPVFSQTLGVYGEMSDRSVSCTECSLDQKMVRQQEDGSHPQWDCESYTSPQLSFSSCLKD